MEPITDSILSSFRRVPPAAIPAMLDCIFVSTAAMPSSLFSDLLKEFPKIIKQIMMKNETMGSEWRNVVVSYVSALCHCLKKSDTYFMHIFVRDILIPVLKLVHTHDHELFNEVTILFLCVVTESNSWEILEESMVPFLLRSIAVSIGMLQTDELIYQWKGKSTSNVYLDDDVIGKSFNYFQGKLFDNCSCQDSSGCSSHDFPLAVSCSILTLILNASLPNKLKIVDSLSVLENGFRVKVFAGNVLWDVTNLTTIMVLESVEHRSAAIRYLLPSICKAFTCHCKFEVIVAGVEQMLTRMDFLRKIWKCCKLLFSLGSLERRDAYDMLSLCLSFSYTADKDVAVGESLVTFDLKADQEFWDEIKRGLLDKESLVRKQSVHILRTSLNLSKHCLMAEEVPKDGGFDSGIMNKRGRWAQEEAKSLGVGRLCKDSEPIFIGQYRWVAFLFLYEMLEEYGTHLVEAAWNHQMELWLRSAMASEDSVQSINQNLHNNHMATAVQIFEWLPVLWERGFYHDNPQVRFLIMRSFLAIEWENYTGFAKLVPKEFILGPLIQGLNDPVHHREFGMKETYSSWAIEAAARFFLQYACCIEERYDISFLVDLSSAPKTYSFGRAGLMCLVECICAAAYGYSKHKSNEIDDDNVVTSMWSPLRNNRAQLLDVLRFILECSKQHFNPKYRHKVCERILSASTSLITAADVPLGSLLHFISSLPLDYSDNGGVLRNVVKPWLHNSNFQLLKSIEEFTVNFIHHQQLKDSFFSYDDEELDAWRSEAKRWAGVLFFLVDGREFIDPILKIIRCHGRSVCQKNYSGIVLVKFLILVSSLVEELEIIQGRRSYPLLKGRLTTEINSHRMIDHKSFMEDQVIDQFVELLFSFLEELVSFAKLSCSIFWEKMPQNTSLPSVVRGKLGGPSQRRLPSSLCTSVLESITSVKVLASVLRWCTQLRTNVQTNSAQTFLWEFCWKVIRSVEPKSEVEAEICIGAYEACAHALRDLVYVFSPLSLDLIADGDKLLLEAKEAPFDVFISNFMENINKIIDGGHLVRTRRAVLMNWKWICLESLLSMPLYARHNEDLSRICKFYYSNGVLSLTLCDIVGSLENAGEVSALPILRSIRLGIELLASRIIDPAAVSSCGLTVEMMWRLVHASWILHVSCNKRRVAPLAALLSAVLHYSVFGDEGMHEFNSVPGPLKWFVEKVLEEGSKSPRTIRLAALHLCGLWLAYPSTIKCYIRELKLLTFYGSVAFDEDFEAELAENYDASAEVSGLSKSLDPELTDVFINTELYARVSVAVLFSKLADMADGSGPTVKVKDRVAAISSGRTFLLELLDTVVNDKDLSKELYKKHSAIHRRKVRAWQMICALSRFVDLEIIEEVTSNLHKSICRNNLPSVRQYLETLAIFIYMKFPSLVGQQLVAQLRNYDLRPQALSSYVFISANVILHAKKENRSAHLDELLPPILPLLTSHHHTLRGFTQILVYHVLEKLLPDSVSSSMSLEKRCFMDLKYYLASNSDCARLRSSMDHHLGSFDPVKSISPSGIFTDRIEDLEFECVPATLMDRVIHFLNDTREELRSSMAKDVAAIKNESIHTDEHKKCGEMVSSQDQSVRLLPNELLQDFQRKITFSDGELKDTTSTFFLEEKTMFGSLSDMENEDMLVDRLLHSRGLIVQKLKAGRQQFILVASLVDRIPNLAGLARTCEVFKAAGLAVADKNILNDKQFQLISVTADKWVPVLEVPVDSMRIFLEKKKQEGFAILGLEQTANSISLDQYKFPTKTVLVLGREKEGIPVEIIHFLDACIEIPQLGVVRSLNVHVSGAIALWEYTRQQRSS